jgi:predicted dehydrogenase
MHIYGLAELAAAGREPFHLAATCDVHIDRAEHVADVAEQLLGTRPRGYSHVAAMLEAEPNLDAIDIVTDPASHHVVACLALEAGKHVLIEKPLGVTVRAGRLINETARKAGRVLAVAENFRRDPLNRLAKAVLEAGAIGEPFMVIQTSILGEDLAGTAWKHDKLGGGFPLEVGVHYADLLLHHFGDIEEVFAYTRIFEPTRVRPAKLWTLYEHLEASAPETISTTSQDTVFGVFRFVNGALGQYSLSEAGHVAPCRERRVFGSRGSLHAPSERTGLPISVSLDSGANLTGQDVLSLVPGYELDEITTHLFGERCVAYSLPGRTVNAKLLAIEFDDFAQAVLHGRPPEVDGDQGLKATALAYSFCEAAHLRNPVLVRDVEAGQVDAYQAEINMSLGLDWPKHAQRREIC